METDNQAFINNSGHYVEKTRWQALVDFFTFVILNVWYRLANKEKHQTLIGLRNLDMYEKKIFLIETINFNKMEMSYTKLRSLEEELRQCTGEFQARLRNHAQNFRAKARQRGHPETYSKKDLESLLTSIELRLKNQALSIHSKLAMEKTCLTAVQNVQANISEIKTKIDRLRIQLSTRDHLQEMAVIFKGMDGEKLSELGEQCLNNMTNFFQELDGITLGMNPIENKDVEANIPNNTTSSLYLSEAERDFWGDVFADAKYVEQPPVKPERTIEKPQLLSNSYN